MGNTLQRELAYLAEAMPCTLAFETRPTMFKVSVTDHMPSIFGFDVLVFLIF